jgi:macrolide-specific efflux system membrane fusion protein
MKFFKKRSNFFITSIVLAGIIGGALYFTQPSAADETAAPALQTAKVRTGDLVVTASGAGIVIPSSQVELGFRTAGVLTELNVTVGDSVQTSQVLARLEENLQAEADFQALFSPLGVALAEGAVAEAQIALDDAPDSLMYLISPDVYYFEVKLTEAQSLLTSLNTDTAATEAVKVDAQKNLERIEYNLKAAQARYVGEYLPLNFTYSWVDEETGEAVTQIIPPSPADITLARTSIESAKVALQDAQTALDIVKIGPEALTMPITALGAQMAKLEKARLAVESTRLSALFDGTVISMDAVVGQTVGTSPIMTIATTEKLLVRFYLDETDLDKVASLPTETGFNLMSGMTVDVEVIAGESLKTLIVPVQALRELSPGSYAVFLVDANGQLTMTPVTVGLRDFANAEILSGLKAGDIVSTGTVETK